jgi:DNA-binding transcriptional ArsR family regulator
MYTFKQEPAFPDRRTEPIQPLDVLVLLKLIAADGKSLSVRKLADSLGGVSKSTVEVALQRLTAHALLRQSEGKRQINRLAARDLLEKAIQWIAPAVIGRFELGLATAHAAQPLADRLRGDADPVVMPIAEGPMRGRAVTPLHPAAPGAAQSDPKLHELLSLVDALRIGGARDREAAMAELRSRI